MDCCFCRVGICPDKRVYVFLKAIYLSLKTDSLPCHKKRQVFAAGGGEFVSKVLMGKPLVFAIGTKSYLIILDVSTKK